MKLFKSLLAFALLASSVIDASAQFSPGPGQGTGTVTSAGMALPSSIFDVTGSPVVTTGTLTGTLKSQTANQFFAAPNGSNGTPAFRLINGADLPAPGLSSLGAVFSATAPSHQFQTGIGLTGGLTFAQPAFSDISGTATTAQLPIGTSGATVPLLNGNNTHSGNNTFSGANSFTGTNAFAHLNVATSAAGSLQLGNQAYVAGSKMKIDNYWTDGVNDAANEGGIWPTSTYAANAISRTVDATTVTGQGSGNLNNGPLAGQFVATFNNGATADVVPYLGDCINLVSSTHCFGMNAIARSASGTSSTLTGGEFDVEFATGSTDAGGSIGIVGNVFNIASNATGIQLGGVGGGTWLNGLVGSDVRGSYLSVAASNTTAADTFMNTSTGTFNTSAIMLGTGASQAIAFGNSFGNAPYLYGDSGKNLELSLSSAGGLFVIKDNSGNTKFTFDQFGQQTNAAVNITAAQGLRLSLFTPASSSAACTTGNISVDASFIYVCTATNTWKRSSLSTF